MELQFQKQEMNCLQRLLSQVQNLEQTQELRLPQGMSGVDRILGCWGQILIRSKEWGRDAVRLSGGVLVWILYSPEDGTQPQRLETWIPFQMDWDLPENCVDGQIRVKALLRFADARLVSAGKILIRVGLGVLAQCWEKQAVAMYQSGAVPEDVELLEECWPLRLPREAGEKAFELEETLTVPPSIPRPEKLVYYRLEPGVSDWKVLSNKVVFRGSARLHVLYLGEDGQLHGWDFDLPFSQYAELEDSHSADAQADVVMAVTALELESDGEGNLHLKAGLTGQYLVDDREMVTTVSDAWSPFRQLQPQLQDLELSSVLDSRRETVTGEQRIPMEADTVVDAQMLTDFPRHRREGDMVTLEQPGTVQLLTLDPEGKLRGTSHRLEGQLAIKADETAALSVLPQTADLQTTQTGDALNLRWEVPVQIQTNAGQGIPMMTGLEVGEKQEPDPGRPSLILRRAGNDRLWDIARACGSTMAAIREVNDLQGQPDPEKLLLIPVI